MKGLSSGAKSATQELVDAMFDRMAYNLLGQIPSLKNKKTIAFSHSPTMTLAHLFLQTLGNQKPLPTEQDALKNLLDTAFNYIEALRGKTKATLFETVESYVKEKRAKNQNPNSIEIKNRITESLDKAKEHFKLIAEAETTKTRNLGKVMNISRVGASMGQTDPVCFFVVIRDGVTCSECKRLHLLPDGVTPRVWKLSELGFGYHKKGQDNAKIAGLHPRCRCSLTMLSPGWGFRNGFVSYISPDHDEHKKQRE